jgi:hypothetical protein
LAVLAAIYTKRSPFRSSGARFYQMSLDGGMRTWVQIPSSKPCGKFKAFVPPLRRLSFSHSEMNSNDSLLARDRARPP